MTMRTALILALAIASMTTAHAQTYQWKDSSGRTVISDTPPPGQAAKSARAIGGNEPSVVKEEKPQEKAADAPKTAAEKDLDFKKRQQESREKAEKEAKEQKVAADKRDNCERARRNLTALENEFRIVMPNEKGERELIDNTRREQEMQRARQIMADSCN
nr:DUF4124 domain-containing protein [Dechloromonas sp.]